MAEVAQHLPDVRQARLDLDDQEGARDFVEREHIDRPAPTGRFEGCQPAGGVEDGCDRVDESRMGGIGDAAKVMPASAKPHLETQIDRGSDPS